MTKVAIGFKTEWKTIYTIVMVTAGIAILAGAVMFFIFVIQGAIGGGVAGGVGALGVMMITAAIAAGNLPEELVLIDDMTVYINKKSIALVDIQTVSASGRVLIIIPKQGKKISQNLVKNSEECAQKIMSRVS